MTKSRTLLAAAISPLLMSAATLPLASTASANSAGATPQITGCAASGYGLLSLAWIATQGDYVLPFRIDAAGNQDGFVCGRPFVQAVYDHVFCPDGCSVPVIYEFRDNDLTPAH